MFLDELEFYEISKETILEYKTKEGYLIEKVRLRAGWLLCGHLVKLLPLDEAIASRAVFVIVSGSDGRKRFLSQLNN